MFLSITVFCPPSWDKTLYIRRWCFDFHCLFKCTDFVWKAIHIVRDFQKQKAQWEILRNMLAMSCMTYWFLHSSEHDMCWLLTLTYFVKVWYCSHVQNDNAKRTNSNAFRVSYTVTISVAEGGYRVWHCILNMYPIML